MKNEDRIFIIPSGPIFFEGETRKIPEDGAFVRPSSYYFRLVRDGSIKIGSSDLQISKAETPKE